MLLENQLSHLLPDPEDENVGGGSERDDGRKKKRKAGWDKTEDAGDVGGWTGPWARPLISPAGLSVSEGALAGETVESMGMDGTGSRWRSHRNLSLRLFVLC